MDRRMAQSLDKYLTTPPEEKEPEALSEKQFIRRLFSYLEIPIDTKVSKEVDTFLADFHKRYCEVEFIEKEES